MKHAIISLFIAIIFAFTAQASEVSARKFTESTAKQAVKLLASDKSDDAKVESLKQLFVKAVDTRWIGRFVIGKYWRELDKTQQTEYLNNYQKFLVKHYTSNFQEYAEGTEFEVTKTKSLKRKGQYMVSMKINRPTDPQPIKVDYRVRQKSGKSQIIDIVVEGISLLNTQRSEFSSVIQRKGASHLIEQIKAKL